MNTELFKQHGITLHVRNSTYDDDRGVLNEILTYDWGIDPIRTFVDVGSHIGAATVYVKTLWPDAEVVAIEPDADNYEVLVQNTQNLSGVTVLRARVGYADQPVYLLQHSSHSTCHSIVRAEDVRSDENYSAAPDAVSLVQVMVLRGWDFVDVLKIDCERCEVPFFAETPDNVLRRVRRFVGEHHSTPQIFMDSIGAHLKRIGYRVSVESDPNRHSVFLAERMCE